MAENVYVAAQTSDSYVDGESAGYSGYGNPFDQHGSVGVDEGEYGDNVWQQTNDSSATKGGANGDGNDCST
eukprot:SAG31_NODE_16415_length_710_cov_0.875614_2_plen_70_part_01